MKKQNKPKEVKPTKKDYLKLVLLFSIIFFVFYIFIKNLSSVRKEEIEFINTNCSYVKAKVVNKSIYKGRSLIVVYKVNGVKYREVPYGFNNDTEVGDSIIIKYSKVNPKLIIVD